MNLVFDFGAVLIDWQPTQLVRAHFPDLTQTPREAQQLARSIFSHQDWHAFDRGQMTPEVVVRRTSERLTLPQAQLLGLVAGIGERLSPLDESVDVLAELEGRRRLRGDVRLYFLSNMPAPYARTLEQRYVFLQWFDGGIFSGDAQCSKPDPAIFQLLQMRYALEPAQTLMIDDTKGNIEAACALGWGGIQFVSAQQLRSSLEDLLRKSDEENS